MLTPLFKRSDIESFIHKKVALYENAIIERLIEVGEQFVADARSKTKAEGGFGDITGNLRASIGYVILKNGREIFGNFEGEREGQQEARRFIKTLSTTYNTGIVLLVVAGMEYAAYVEAKGYDVITGAGQKASVDIKKKLSALMSKLMNK